MSLLAQNSQNSRSARNRRKSLKTVALTQNNKPSRRMSDAVY